VGEPRVAGNHPEARVGQVQRGEQVTEHVVIWSRRRCHLPLALGSVVEPLRLGL
jgi:hypothetical protein